MNTKDIRPLRIVFVYEYARPDSDWMLTSLVQSLYARWPSLKASYVHGLFTTYRPGGFHPTRLINFLWVNCWIAIRLLFSRPDLVLVRTAPPGVQLWTVWWAQFRGIPVFCWLMDCHPEMEARQLEARGYPSIARLLRHLDERLMPRFAAIITLDSAMAAFARKLAPKVEIIVHPTWGGLTKGAFVPVSYRPGRKGGPLHLAYSGNLGAAHDLSTFTALLEKLLVSRPAKLFVIGASSEGMARFQRIGKKLGLSIEGYPRVPFIELRLLYEKWEIDLGVVLLSDASAGLVSPSKFSGYINFGIPLVYVGPPDTNTAEVCERFNGGLRIPNGASAEQVGALSEAILDPTRLAAAAHGAKDASAYFSGFDGDSLAESLGSSIAKFSDLKCQLGEIVETKA
jgi:hypothetical protein